MTVVVGGQQPLVGGLPAAVSGLPRDSVINVTALVTLDKADLTSQARRLPASLMDEVDRGLRRIFGL